MTGNKGAGLRWITKPRQIGLARKEGAFFRGEHLFLWVSVESCGKSDLPVVGIVFRRGFKRAVDRNLAKRRIRGCIMEVRDLLEPGRVYLIESKPGAELMDYKLLVFELKELISRIET